MSQPSQTSSGPIRHLWVVGVLLWVVDFVFVLVPAGMSGGELHIGPAAVLFLGGLICVAVSIGAVCARVNRENNGALGMAWGFGWRAAGTVYLGYKVGLGVARHLHREITR